MWNSEKPLNLFRQMSNVITENDLKKLQNVIDEDKDIDNRRHDRDVCGEYAPFCEYCNKNVSYPCAQAYIKMKKVEGYDVSSVEETAMAKEESHVKEKSDETDEPAETVEEKPKKLIRIAHIKRTK